MSSSRASLCWRIRGVIIALKAPHGSSSVAIRFRRASLLAVLGALALPAAASAADSIYWPDFGPNTIRVANLDGSGAASNLFAEPALSRPRAVALDPAAGKIYWTDQVTNNVRVANLDGSGVASTLFAEPAGSAPWGVAIDPAGGKIYWSDLGASTIRVANLDGPGTASTLFAEAAFSWPAGVAIDPAGGKIYWANVLGNTIRVANLDGSGTASTLFAEPGGLPFGVAIDPAAGNIYWADFGPNTIRVANLDGSGAASTLFAEPALSRPLGVAIDPSAGRIYWTNFGNDTTQVANLDGSGAASTLFAEPAGSQPGFAALLRSPLGTGLPVVSGGSVVGAELSCTEGQWAADLVGAFLYRAPESLAYQWSRSEAEIPGATKASLTASEPGSYTCKVIAANQADSASQTSAPWEVGASPLNLALQLSKPLSGSRLKATVGCAADCSATLSGYIRVKLGGKASAASRTVKSRITDLIAAEPAIVKLPMKRRTRSAVKRALRRGHKVKATVRARATGQSGTVAIAKAKVRLRSDQIGGAAR